MGRACWKTVPAIATAAPAKVPTQPIAATNDLSYYPLNLSEARIACAILRAHQPDFGTILGLRTLRQVMHCARIVSGRVTCGVHQRLVLRERI